MQLSDQQSSTTMNKNRRNISAYWFSRSMLIEWNVRVQRKAMKLTNIVSVFRSSSQICRESTVVRLKWCCSIDDQIQFNSAKRQSSFILPKFSKRSHPLRAMSTKRRRPLAGYGGLSLLLKNKLLKPILLGQNFLYQYWDVYRCGHSVIDTDD